MEEFADYVRHGWALCPIAPGTKSPTGKDWNERANAITSPADAGQLHGAGLLHRWSGTCALDIDEVPTAISWLRERGFDLEGLLGSHPVRIDSGRAGRAKLLFALPDWLPSVKTAPFIDPISGEKHTALDFRCGTASGLSVQDVLPPTIHPDTGLPYMWGYADPLLGHWSNLPEMPGVLLSVWKSLLGDRAKQDEAAPQIAAVPEEIQALLLSQDPDAVYNDWIRVGMAVHSATGGSRAGFALWREWSARGKKYKGPADLEPHWRSFTVRGGVTIGSLRSDVVATADAFPVVEESVVEESRFEVEQDAREAVRDYLETKLIYVTTQDAYFSSAQGHLMESDRSIRHLLCPEMPLGMNGQGEAVSVDPLTWLQYSKTKTKVRSVAYHPGAGKIFSEDGETYLNRYTRPKVEALEPLPHEREAFEYMWSQLKEQKFQLWLMQFYAHCLQKPGVKIQSMPLLFGQQTGSGKNTIARRVPELLFGTAGVRTVPGDVLSSTFTDVLGETWFLYLEELRTGGSKAERITIANKIKSWITDDWVTVHPKGLKPYPMRNRFQVIATSNFDDAVQIDNNDRRVAACEMKDSMSEKAAFDLYAGFLNTPRAAGVLKWIFQGVSTTGFNPAARAPLTESRTVMIRAGISEWESNIIERMAKLESPFDRDIFKLNDVLAEVPGVPRTAHQLGRVLRGDPFHCETIKTGGNAFWCWRRKEYWQEATPAARDEYWKTGKAPEDAPPALRPDFVEQLNADAG